MNMMGHDSIMHDGSRLSVEIQILDFSDNVKARHNAGTAQLNSSARLSSGVAQAKAPTAQVQSPKQEGF
jgi:hypothetical protein